MLTFLLVTYSIIIPSLYDVLKMKCPFFFMDDGYLQQKKFNQSLSIVSPIWTCLYDRTTILNIYWMYERAHSNKKSSMVGYKFHCKETKRNTLVGFRLCKLKCMLTFGAILTFFLSVCSFARSLASSLARFLQSKYSNFDRTKHYVCVCVQEQQNERIEQCPMQMWINQEKKNVNTNEVTSM